MSESVVGPWAREKLECLDKYLRAYTTILKEQAWVQDYMYIDAFAGPGVHAIRSEKPEPDCDIARDLLDVAEFGNSQEEQREFLRGSPRIALDIPHPFTKYIFLERSPERVAALQSLQHEYQNRRNIEIRQGDCTGFLVNDLAESSTINWKRNRAVVFLDPFGMQVNWATIEALANTKAIEILLNFPVGMAIQRLLLRDPDQFTPSQVARLDEYFGTPAWKDELYKKPQSTLFDMEEQKIENSGVALLNWYRSRLKETFGFASKAALIRNTKRGHLYYLLLASPNATGVRIANHILSAGDYI